VENPLGAAQRAARGVDRSLQRLQGPGKRRCNQCQQYLHGEVESDKQGNLYCETCAQQYHRSKKEFEPITVPLGGNTADGNDMPKPAFNLQDAKLANARFKMRAFFDDEEDLERFLESLSDIEKRIIEDSGFNIDTIKSLKELVQNDVDSSFKDLEMS